MGFLTRLRKDVRGNALAIMAASIIPLAGLVGGGIDMSRMYIVKTRLQHACDAGSLAGRKAMGGGTWNQSNNTPNTIARKFFAGNFVQNSYGSTNLTYSYGENAGKVTGTASAAVPMTLMRIFGLTQTTISVTCDSEMRLPNTDVMFVLDNTGSMGDKLTGDTQTKIVALRNAVKCFYEIVARLPTDGSCGAKPSGGTGAQTQIRFGFVPFDTNVNVGRLLSPDWFANNWTYQSREAVQVSGSQTGFSDGNKTTASSTNATATTTSKSACQTLASGTTSQSTGALGLGKSESNGGIQSHGNWQASQPWQDVTLSYSSWASGNNGCKYTITTKTYTRTYTYQWVAPGTSGAVVFSAWLYHPVSYDIHGLKNGTGWNNSINEPIGDNFTSKTIPWEGCIEERKTVRQSSYVPIPSGARDLDIDGIPSQSDADSLWAPALGNLIYARKATYSNSSAANTAAITTFTNYTGQSTACGVVPAHKMEAWNDPTAFDNYVNTMKPGANTYHDIGLLWGARLMSPTGLFSSENALTPSGGEIMRNMIFMTDGDACTSGMNYQAYGLSWFDRRETDPSLDIGTNQTCSSDSGGPGPLTKQVEARSAALCTAIKNKNITLWVIYFGTPANSTITTQMTNCASPGRFFLAGDSAALQATFTQIANQISQLRLTK